MRQTLISIAYLNSALFFKIYNLRCGVGKPRLSRIGVISYSTIAATFESRNTYAPLQRRLGWISHSWMATGLAA